MKARELAERCQAVVVARYPEDGLLYGDPEAKVRGIQVCWMASTDAIECAAAAGLFIAGESDNYGMHFAWESGVPMIETSHELTENPGLERVRLHSPCPEASSGLTEPCDRLAERERVGEGHRPLGVGRVDRFPRLEQEDVRVVAARSRVAGVGPSCRSART